MTNPIIVAHHLPPEMAAPIAAGLPDGVILRPTPPGRPWDLGNAEVLIGFALALRNAGEGAQARPEFWPGALRWMHLRTTGIDEFPDWIMDVPVLTVTRGAPAIPIAEFVLAAMLSLEKQMPEIWIRDAARWRPRGLGTLEGATLGIIGFGHIGRAIAQRALAFGMHVLAHRRTGAPSPMTDVDVVPLEIVLAESDHLVIAAPLTKETRGLIGADAFARMKPGAHLINIARGGIIEEQALRAALDSGRLRAATLDVTDPEPLPAVHFLYAHPRVRLSPHLSYSAPDTGKRGAEAFLSNLRCYCAGDLASMHGQVDRQARY